MENATGTITIDSNGIYKYLFDSPTYPVIVEQADKSRYRYPEDGLLYVMPRDGDILLHVEVTGSFKEAILYQYDFGGVDKIVYATLNQEGIMNPFPESGFPLLQAGKGLYLNVIGADADKVQVTATYALLETKSRMLLARYLHENTENGVKVVHANKDIYQVICVMDIGHSPNCLVKLPN